MENVSTSNEILETENKFVLLVNAFVNINHLSKMEFLKHAFDTVFKLVDEAEKGSYYELVDDNYIALLGNGYDMEELSKLKFTVDEAFIDFESPISQLIDSYEISVARRDESLFSSETIQIFKNLGTYENFRSLYAPIFLGYKKIGIICLENFSGKHFSVNSKALLKLFAQQFSNIYTLKHYKEEMEIRCENITKVLVKTIEVKDKYTLGHANRVKEISSKIAYELEFSIEQIHDLETAAILHDVGKIGTPTAILLKPTSLTKMEYDTIKEHPFHAKRILDDISEFSNISNITYCHHENYDGSGYPRGLKNDEIPLEAQIIQVADAFDAMTSDRSYRNAFSVEKALSIMIEGRGKQFNPKLVDIIVKLYR
ncbi:MAG: HD-GYP domain-containing protein [Acidaminobacteraceae bacterium]